MFAVRVILKLGIAAGMVGLTVAPARSAPAPNAGIPLLLRAIAEEPDPAFREDILRGVNGALSGRRHVDPPAEWDAVRSELLDNKDEAIRELARSVGIVFGDPKAFEAVRGVLADAGLPPARRLTALNALLMVHDKGLAPTLQHLIPDKDLGPAAIAGLADYDVSNIAGNLLDAYGGLAQPARNAALAVLAGRVGSAKLLIGAVQAGRVPRRDLTAATVQRLRDLNDRDVDVFVGQYWGVTRVTPADKAKQIAKFRQVLNRARLALGDTSNGRVVFMKTCAVCHTLFGEGGHVGPELTGADRTNLDYILTNVVDPSAVISKEFQLTLVRTKAGRVISGIATEDANGIKLVSDTGTVIVPRGDISKVKLSDMSMMPEGLLSGLAEQDLVDLVTYLRLPGQVPLPPGAAPTTAPK